MGWREKFFLHIMVWAGLKLFPHVSVYVPDGEDDSKVTAIHFADSETDLQASCRYYLTPETP